MRLNIISNMFTSMHLYLFRYLATGNDYHSLHYKIYLGVFLNFSNNKATHTTPI